MEKDLTIKTKFLVGDKVKLSYGDVPVTGVKSQSFLPLLRIIVADSSKDSCELAEISSC